MGRKPVLGLVGACLASVTLAGGCQNSPVRPDNSTVAANQGRGTNPAWRTNPAGSGVAPGSGNAFGGGTTVGGPSGGGVTASAVNAGGTSAFNGAGTATGSSVAAGGAAGGYPEGNSMRTAGGAATVGTGAGDRDAYPPTASVSGSRTTVPTDTSARFDPSAGGVPPSPGGIPALPPMVTGGPAKPRVDDLSSGRGAVVVPPSGSGASIPSLPPPAQPPVPASINGGSDRSASDGLPPMPSSQMGLSKPPLPVAPPLPAGSMVPTRPPVSVMPVGGSDQ